VKSTVYEAPHYAVLSSLRLLRPSYVKMFSSAPCSQTPLIYALPLTWETKFHTHTKQHVKYSSVYFITDVLRKREKRDSERNGSKHSRNLIALYLSAMSFDLLLTFPNIWTLPHFQMIYCDLALHSADVSWTCTFIFSAFTSRPNPLHVDQVWSQLNHGAQQISCHPPFLPDVESLIELSERCKFIIL
jgi:hypothetical protein